jgi:hypothetical protein
MVIPHIVKHATTQALYRMVGYNKSSNNKEVKTTMPKTLEQLANAKRGVKRAGGQKVKFAPIVAQIVSSKLYYTVTEVWKGQNMVNKRVSRFRTMKLLNKAVAARRLMKLYENGMFHYGVPKPPTT